MFTSCQECTPASLKLKKWDATKQPRNCLALRFSNDETLFHVIISDLFCRVRQLVVYVLSAMFFTP